MAVSTSSRAAASTGRKKTGKLKREELEARSNYTRPTTSPYIGVDRESNRQAFYTQMGKKNGGGGPSKRGSHRCADAGGCEVRWYYSHYNKLRPAKGSFYLDFGTLVHTGLAYFYAERMDRKPEWYIAQPDAQLAIEEDSKGNETWLRNCKSILKAYERFEAGDPWNPKFIEEEFAAKVGALDPDGKDEPAEDIEYVGPCSGWQDAASSTSAAGVEQDRTPCDNRDETGNHIHHLIPKVWHLPTLNEEEVTCRPDMVIEKNGFLWCTDHKTAGAARNGSGRLPVIDERYPDYTYFWQAMFNLTVLRQHMDIRGFLINRIKRDVPYDFARDLFSIPARQYAKVPRTIRDCIRKERDILRKVLRSPKDLIAHPWECKAGWACDYTKLCYAEDVGSRDLIARTEFVNER